MMTEQGFFEEQSDESAVKTAIVTAYFPVWAKIIGPSVRKASGKIGYIDLFAGPGIYADKTPSTPLLVLEQAIADPGLRELLVASFNDKNPANAETLRQGIADLPGIDALVHTSTIYNNEVADDLAEVFEKMSLIPTLAFIDPWGYKGLTLRLVGAIVKDWGCECLFFFNYNRINMGLNNPLVEEHMSALFGDERAEALRDRLETLDSTHRELAIVEALTTALKESCGKYVLTFTFKNASGARTTQHLFFVTKAFLGYEIMKDIMAKQSTSADQGVPSLAYCAADREYPQLFDLTSPLDDLGEILLSDFAGQQLTMKDVYMTHSVGKPFIKTNYKEVLKALEEEGKVEATPPKSERRANTFADHVKVTFPPKDS